MYSPKTPLILGKVKVYFIQDMTKAIRFNDTFRYIDNLFIANDEEFGNHIGRIYTSELELKDNFTLTTEACYPLHVRISGGGGLLPYISFIGMCRPFG